MVHVQAFGQQICLIKTAGPLCASVDFLQRNDVRLQTCDGGCQAVVVEAPVHGFTVVDVVGQHTQQGLCRGRGFFRHLWVHVRQASDDGIASTRFIGDTLNGPQVFMIVAVDDAATVIAPGAAFGCRPAFAQTDHGAAVCLADRPPGDTRGGG